MNGFLARFSAGAKFVGVIVLCLLPFTPNWEASEKVVRADGRTVIHYCDSITPLRQHATLELIAAFEKENPDVDVVVEFVPSNNFLITMLSRFAAGRAPDVLRISGTNTGGLASKGMFVDLYPYVKRDGLDLSDLYDTVMHGFTYDGKLIGLPYYFASFALAYNTDLFDEAGVPYPSEDWTWEDLREAARRLTRDFNGDGRIDQYGIEVTTNNIMAPLVFAESSWLGEDRKTWLGNSPETLRAMQFAMDLVVEDRVSPTQDERQDLGFAHMGMLLAKKVAMTGIGPMDIAILKDSKIRWQVAEFPPRVKGAPRGSRWNGDAYTMTVHCKNQDAAWRLVKFMISDRAQMLVVELGEGIPTRRSIAQRYFVNPKTPWREEVFLRTAEYAKFTDETWRPEFASELDAWRQLTLLGNLSARDAMERFTPMAKLLLADEKDR